MPHEIHELLRWISPAAVLVMAGWLALGRLCEAYEPVAKFFGRLGSWLRRKAIDNRASDYNFLQHRIADLEKIVSDQREDINQQDLKITKLELTEEVNAVRQDMMAEYLRVDAQWHIEATVEAAEQDVKLPNHLSFTAFCREYRVKHHIPLNKAIDNGRIHDR